MDNDIKLDMEQRARASEIEEMVIDDPEWAASAIVWQRDQLAAAEARAEKAEKRECRHGWRGGPINVRLAERCPSCGTETLYIGSGGWLTCSILSCKAPGAAADVLDAARAEGGE